MPAERAVVIMGRHVQPGLAQRQAAIVEIKKIGPIAVDQVLTAQPPHAHESRIGQRRVFVPYPVMTFVEGIRGGDAGKAVRHGHDRPAIKLLRVQAIPPAGLAVIFGKPEGIVTLAGARAFRVIAIGHLKPVPGMG